MPRNLYSDQIARVMRKTVFGVKDLADLGVPKEYARQRLHKLCSSEKIRRVEKGKYTASDDPFLVAAHLTEPCYISLWSALSEMGLTTQIPFSIQVITSRKRYSRRLTFLGTEIRFHHVRPEMMFGYEYRIKGEGHRIPIARVEKVIIDAIYLNEIPLEELDEALEHSDPCILKEYSELTNNNRVKDRIREIMVC